MRQQGAGRHSQSAAWAFETYKTHSGFTKFDVMTWGAIDGSNTWMDFDVLAVFTLYHLPPRWALGTYMALKGLKDEKWMNEYQEILTDIHEGHLVSSLVQAAGRVRSRRVVDKLGNCAPARVYLMLGGRAEGERILSDVRAMLPGLPGPQPWAFAGAKRLRPGRDASHAPTLVKFLAGAEARWWSVTEVRAKLGITSDTTWKRLVSQMKNSQDPLAESLAALGARYHVEGMGRGSRAYLVKE
jgi:hypothetical protein